MKSTNVKSDLYAEYNVDSNKKYPKFELGDHVRISKYNNIFAKEYTPNWSDEVFVIKIEMIIKRKGNKLFVKGKRYENSFNSWIDKSDLI